MNREPAGEQFGATFQETCSTVTWWSSWFEAIFGKILDSWCIFKPLKTNIEPENGPLEEDTPFLETHNFSGFMLNFGKCACPKNKYPKRNQTRIDVVVFKSRFSFTSSTLRKMIKVDKFILVQFLWPQIFDPFHSHVLCVFARLYYPVTWGLQQAILRTPRNQWLFSGMSAQGFVSIVDVCMAGVFSVSHGSHKPNWRFYHGSPDFDHERCGEGASLNGLLTIGFP